MDNKVTYSEYLKALETIDNYFKNRQEPNQYGAFNDSLKNEITFALRWGINELDKKYDISLAAIECLAGCVENALYEKYHDNNGKVSTMDAFFNIRRKFVIEELK